jgi:hypothetical protein
MGHYEIEFSEKENGWVPKKMGSDYGYKRVKNSPALPTIEEAEEWIRTNHKSEYSYDRPWIDHTIDGYTGHLMTLDEWKADCDSGGFIDYDGFGDLVTADYKLLGEETCPSEYTKHNREYPAEAKYVLWYNK